MDKGELSEADRIIEKATALFAELGFDGTTIDMIAESAHVDKAAIREAFPSNGALYREVMHREMKAQEDAVIEAKSRFIPTRQALEHLVDNYLDFNVEHPELMKLLQHRRTGDAADTAEIEDRHAPSKLAWIADQLRDSVPEPEQLDYLLWTIPWVVTGFLSHGFVYSDPHRQRSKDEPISTAEVEAFREYLHYLARRLFELPE